MTFVLNEKNISLKILVEPTCGLGSILLKANLSLKPEKSLGIEIQSHYTERLSKEISNNTTLLNQDFFKSMDSIKKFIGDVDKLLFVGNPPRVTNSELSAHFSKISR